MLGDGKSASWWTARRKFSIRDSILYRNIAEAPDAAYVNIVGDFSPPTATLDIEPPTMPDTMIVALLTVLRLPLRTVRRCPLRRQIPLCGRQRSDQPQHGAADAQRPKNVLSRLRHHG